MSAPKVSIIVPVYNVEKYIKKCIGSILSQTFENFELILVDDCSKDNSLNICNELYQNDSRIKIIKNTNNIGVSLSRRIGLEASIGDYIQYIDSDDWIEKDMIEKMYGKAISENFDMVVCDYCYEKNNTGEIHEQRFNSFEKIAIIKNILSMRISTFLCDKMVKRELYETAQFPEFNRGEDYVITIQNVYNAGKIGYINKPFYHYRYHEKSLSNNKLTSVNGRIEENKNWIKVVDFLKDKYDEDLRIFEPELGDHINYFKFKYITDKKLMFNKELYKLYPESNFCKNLLKSIIKKIYYLTVPELFKIIIRKILVRRINFVWRNRIKPMVFYHYYKKEK
jgi:glycosyltransferase involved in cell wall biosynthesis